MKKFAKFANPTKLYYICDRNGKPWINLDKEYLSELYCKGFFVGQGERSVPDRIYCKKVETETLVTICNILDLSNHYK